MAQVHLSDLTSYHRAKIFAKARAWRLQNHLIVLGLIRLTHNPSEPVGAAMFSPERWTGENWVWFRENILMQEIMR